MSKPWQGQSVVIVDDSPAVRDELKRVFEAVGMRVAGLAPDGVVGLQLVEKLSPSLVSLDLIMPEMDGIECYRKLLMARPQQKVVVISWLGAEQKILENLKSTIPLHLIQAKPVTAEVLAARLERVYGVVAAPAANSAAKSFDMDPGLPPLGAKIS